MTTISKNDATHPVGSRCFTTGWTVPFHASAMTVCMFVSRAIGIRVTWRLERLIGAAVHEQFHNIAACGSEALLYSVVVHLKSLL